MALKVMDRFPGANARILAVRDDAQAPEIVFSADPRGGTEALWFDFRYHDAAPPATIARIPSNTYDGGSRWPTHRIHAGRVESG